jgi:hypothetical protein
MPLNLGEDVDAVKWLARIPHVFCKMLILFDALDTGA